MMVGYALFSETITINGTATTKGDFAITPTCVAGITDDVKNLTSTLAGIEQFGTEGGYSNDTCSVNGNTVSYSANLKYPGATRYFTITLKNTGSISAYGKDSTGEFKICTDENAEFIRNDVDSFVMKPDQSIITLGYLNWDSSLSTQDYNNKLFKLEYVGTLTLGQYDE